MRFAGYPRCLIGGEVNDRRRDVFRLADSAKKRLLTELLEGVDEPLCMNAVGFDRAGIDGVNANFSRCEFLCKRSREAIYRRFGGVINAASGRRGLADH